LKVGFGSGLTWIVFANTASYIFGLKKPTTLLPLSPKTRKVPGTEYLANIRNNGLVGLLVTCTGVLFEGGWELR
jgi:hypothetical protein